MSHELEMSQDDLRLRERLREAAKNEPVPPFLETRIRARIEAEASLAQGKTRWFGGWAMASAALALLAAAGIAYELGHLRFTAASQNAYIAKVSRQVASIMRVGLGDHLHCAFFRKFPGQPPPMQEFVQKMGPEYAGLIPIVQQNVPKDVRIELAHRCRFQGRQFVHLALRGDGQLLSLVVARKADGESFAIEGMLPSLVQSGLPVYRAGVRKFEIAAFESRDHLVYLISDLPGDRNMERMLAMSPALRGFFDNLERL